MAGNYATRQPVDVVGIGMDRLAAVDEIMAAAFDPRYGEAWNSAQVLATLAMPGYQLRGAYLGDGAGQLAGFAIFRIIAGESELLLLAVHPRWRRSGVATALMNDWLSICSGELVTMAFLEMREDNPARDLYRAFGFVEVALRKSYYRGNDGTMRNAVTMNKMVTAF